MSSREVILCIDEGTSGTRAAVVDRSGWVSCQTHRPLRVDTPSHGVVEQDADQILAQTVDVCRATIARSTEQGFRIVGAGLSAQRASAVLWDTGTGRALVPSMVWQDSRHRHQLADLGRHWDARLRTHTGRPVGNRSPYLWAAHHLRTTPSVARAFDQGRLAFGTIDTWLLWHLSDRQECVTTPTHATAAGAYVPGEHRYALDWIDQLGFPAGLLPLLREDADSFGLTRGALLGIDVPILASLGDQMAGAIGLGCLDRGQVLCVHGTGSFIDALSGSRLPVPGQSAGAPLMVTARRVNGISVFGVEGQVATTGSALDRVCDTLHWFDDVAAIDVLAGTVSDSGGLIFIPALAGLRTPWQEPMARAALSGLSMATTRAALARALLEGIAHSAADCLQACLAVMDESVSEIRVGGGLSASATLLQIQADLAGAVIRSTVGASDASLRGAAFLAGSSGRLWGSLAEATKTLVTAAVFEPAIGDDARGERRRYWQERVQDEIRHARATFPST